MNEWQLETITLPEIAPKIAPIEEIDDNEYYLVLRIVLFKKRGEVVIQAFVEAAAGNDDRREWCVVGSWFS